MSLQLPPGGGQPLHAVYENRKAKGGQRHKGSGCRREWRPGERLAFSIDRGELARTAVHGADLQERGVFRPAAKGLPEKARRRRGQVIHWKRRNRKFSVPPGHAHCVRTPRMRARSAGTRGGRRPCRPRARTSLGTKYRVSRSKVFQARARRASKRRFY